MRIRFKTEQYRLLSFATVSKLSENEETLFITSANRDILLRVLDQQTKMMLRFGKLDDRLQPLAQPFIQEEPSEKSGGQDPKNPEDELADRFPQDNVLLNKALDFVHRTSRYPKQLRFVVFDRSKLDELLSRLVASNDFLQELLNTHQLEQLRQQELNTSYQIMQLNSQMDQLQEIVQASLHAVVRSVNGNSLQMAAMGMTSSRSLAGVPASSSPDASALASKLAELGQFKAIACAVDKGGLTADLRVSVGLEAESPTDLPLQLHQDDVILDERSDGELGMERRVAAWYHPHDGVRRRVWIEWKRMDPKLVYDAAAGPDPDILRRFQTLVTLLRQRDLVKHFWAPPCLGYYLREASMSGIQYGLLFQNPPEADPHATPRSLRELLDAPSAAPSLTTRINLLRKLAQALEKLHAVNWLHKGLSSDNVIFFTSEDAEPADPYLTGFDYSRPDSAASMSSSSPLGCVAEDLYRHPGVQGGPREASANHHRGGSGFRKRHDIYSLGVVLAEIARWQPVEAVLGLGDRRRVRVKDVLGARDRLLSHELRGLLRGTVGDAATGAIIACLVGPRAFGLAESDVESEGQVAAKLQMRFYDIVVKPLTEISI